MLTQEERVLVKDFLERYPKGVPYNAWGRTAIFVNLPIRKDITNISRDILEVDG